MKFLIIGAGKTGYAVSAFLLNQGHDVFLYTRDREKALAINRTGIHARGAVEGHFKPEAVWQLEKIMDQVTHILVFTTANAHAPVFRQLENRLHEDQRIIVFNGNWGGYEGYRILKPVIAKKKIIVAETGSMPFIAALESPSQVKIKTIKEQTTISAVFTQDTDIVVAELNHVFPGLIKARNIVETSICATNPVIHVPICVFNFARIENDQEFKFYSQGASYKTVDYITHIDRERIGVAAKLGVACGTVLETINSYWPKKFDNLYSALRENFSYKQVTGPKTLDHRYLDEDIPFGLVPVMQLGRELGITTPYTSALVQIASFYANKDFMADSVKIDLNQLKTLTGVLDEQRTKD